METGGACKEKNGHLTPRPNEAPVLHLELRIARRFSGEHGFRPLLTSSPEISKVRVGVMGTKGQSDLLKQLRPRKEETGVC